MDPDWVFVIWKPGRERVSVNFYWNLPTRHLKTIWRPSLSCILDMAGSIQYLYVFTYQWVLESLVALASNGWQNQIVNFSSSRPQIFLNPKTHWNGFWDPLWPWLAMADKIKLSIFRHPDHRFFWILKPIEMATNGDDLSCTRYIQNDTCKPMSTGSAHLIVGYTVPKKRLIKEV